PLARPTLWLALAVPGALFAVYILRVRAALEAAHETPILQGVSDFLWFSRDFTAPTISRVLALLPLALFSALPSSLILYLVLSREADSESRTGAMPPDAFRRAEALALTS